MRGRWRRPRSEAPPRRSGRGGSADSPPPSGEQTPRLPSDSVSCRLHNESVWLTGCGLRTGQDCVVGRRARQREGRAGARHTPNPRRVQRSQQRGDLCLPQDVAGRRLLPPRDADLGAAEEEGRGGNAGGGEGGGGAGEGAALDRAAVNTQHTLSTATCIRRIDRQERLRRSFILCCRHRPAARFAAASKPARHCEPVPAHSSPAQLCPMAVAPARTRS